MSEITTKQNLLLKGKETFHQWRDLITIHLLKAKEICVVEGKQEWSKDNELLLESTLIICDRIEESLSHFDITDHPSEILQKLERAYGSGGTSIFLQLLSRGLLVFVFSIISSKTLL